MSLASQIATVLTRIGTEFKTVYGQIGALGSLTTTDKTSLVAAVNEVKAGSSGAPPDATETVKGVLELATQTETNTGTDDARAVTPLKFQTRLAAYALPLSYLDTDTSLAANSDSKVASQKAVKAYTDALIGAANAMVFKGVIDASSNPNYPAANAGDTYRISVAGKIGGASGVNVEVGDMIVCLTDGTSAGTQAAVGANWDVIQVNIDGAVVGPSSATDLHLASFSGTSGKLLADSGVAVSTDDAMAANSDAKVPTESTVLSYLGSNYYTQTQVGDPATDFVTVFEAALV